MGRTPNNNRQKLIDTATELIWQNSYGSVSVDDICRHANLNKGSFYYYFPSKADLAVAAMEDSFEKNMRPVLEEIFAPHTPPLDRFSRLAALAYQKQKDIAEQYGRVCGCPFAALGSEIAGQEEEIRRKTEEIFSCHRQYYRDTVEDMIKAGMLPDETDAEAKAVEIHGYFLGQIIMARIQNSLKPLEVDLVKGIEGILGIKTITADAA